MDEAGWLACDDPHQMLALLRGQASARKLRLFAVACSRRVWVWIDAAGRMAVETAERFADGLADAEELRAARLACRDAGGQAAWYAAATDPGRAAGNAARSSQAGVAHQGLGAAEAAERVAQCHLLRCIFANPFRTISFDPGWHLAAVVAAARVAYDKREMPQGTLDPAQVTALAEARGEAAAGDAILAHLFGPGPHVRGCFALDLCLAKE